MTRSLFQQLVDRLRLTEIGVVVKQLFLLVEVKVRLYDNFCTDVIGVLVQLLLLVVLLLLELF